jgi:hypothetical protein
LAEEPGCSFYGSCSIPPTLLYRVKKTDFEKFLPRAALYLGLNFRPSLPKRDPIFLIFSPQAAELLNRGAQLKERRI